MFARSTFLGVWALLLSSASAQAVPPCVTDDSSTVGVREGSVELVSTPDDTSVALKAGFFEGVQLSAGVPSLAAPEPDGELKWRLLALDRTSAAVKLLPNALGHAIVLSTRLERVLFDVSSGLEASSAAATFAAPGDALFALELEVEDLRGAPTGRAAFVQPVLEGVALNLDLSGTSAEVGATVGLTVGSTFAFRRSGSERP